MINILCLKWGVKYGPEYVNILFSAIKRNTTVPFKFHCFTDNTTGINDGIQTHPLPFNDIEGWWNKLYMFSPDLPFKQNDHLLFVDLDTLITDNIDHLLTYKPLVITVLRDFYTGISRSVTGNDSVGSGLMAWRHRQYDKIWAEFVQDPKAAMRSVHPHGDQRWIQKHAAPRRYWQDVLPNSVVSFKVHCLNGLPPKAAVVCYHGKPSIPESITARMKDWIWTITPQPWVADYWTTTPPKNTLVRQAAKASSSIPTPPPPSRSAVPTSRRSAIASASSPAYPTVKTYFAMLPASEIFGSVGRCGGGHNTVWEDWSKQGRQHRAQIIQEFEAGINRICGHYTRLEASILAEGMQSPLVITCGPPFRRKMLHLPPEMRFLQPSNWLTLEGFTGGSRLWVAQQHNLMVPCFINDRTGRFEGSERITTTEQAAAKYRIVPAAGTLRMDPKVGLVEQFDGTKVGSHLGPEWSEEKIVRQRAPLWVGIMNRHGYYVDRLSPDVQTILREAGVIQPEHLRNRLTSR